MSTSIQKKPESLLSANGFYFLAQGVAILVGWTGILSSLDFFYKYLADYDVSFTFPCSIYLAHTLASAYMFPINRMFTVNQRVEGSLILYALTLLILPFVAIIFKNTTLGFWLVMFVLFINGFISQVYQATVCGMAAQLSGFYSATFMLGCSLASLLMTVLRVIFLVVFPDSLDFEIYVYFGVSTAFLLYSIFLHRKVKDNEVFRPLTTQNSYTKLLDEEGSSKTNIDFGVDFKVMFEIAKKQFRYVGSLFITYIQTFICFPGLMLLKPTPGLHFDWKIVTMIGTYNLFDVLGKYATNHVSLFNKNSLVNLVACRWIFLATFLLQATTVSIPILNTMWFGYLNIALFSFTNGFATNVAFILGPGELKSDFEKDVAGFLGVVGLTTGIMCGAFLALPFSYIQPLTE